MRLILNEQLSLSPIIMGCMRMDSWNYDLESRAEFIEWCINNGITSFDHADIYGGNHRNEKLFGEVLNTNKSLREGIEIITKCSICFENNSRYYNTDYNYIINQVEESIKNLGCDYIDILLIHMFDLLVDPQEVNRAFNYLTETGKVRNFGVSNHSPLEYETMQKYIDVKLVTNQILLNPLNIENYTNGTMTHSIKENIHPMIWSPLAGGKIVNPVTEFEKKMNNILNNIREEIGVETIEEVIYKWLFKHISKPGVIIGTGNRERIKIALNSLKGPQMTRNQWYKITSEAGYKFW